ncbi:MAG TPA: S9 family peptidase [Caulobacteraceae bacterium]|jgi:dipeptidyl aminopeptidase/acylaminoacyl peptidase|nr:S9 family peptidase [Caulobacteraceae bacterium]
MRQTSMIALVALAAALSPPAFAQSAAQGAVPPPARQAFQPIDLFALQAASDPQIDPAGTRVAYVRESFDLMSDKPRRTIWLVDVGSGAQQPLDGTAGESSPRWSPDGRRLAFVAAGPDGRPQIHVAWLDGHGSASVSDLADRPGALVWSPDGAHLVFSMRVPEKPPELGQAPAKPEGAKWADPIKVITRVHYRQDDAGYLKNGYAHLFEIAADGGAARQLTFGDFDDHGPVAFGPDGRSVVFASARQKGWELDPQNVGLWRLDLASGAMTPLPHHPGPDRDPAISPDGRRLAFVRYEDRNRGYEDARLTLLDLADPAAQPRSLTDAFDRSLSDPRWSGDGRFLFVDFVDHGVTKVARVAMDGHVEVVAAGLGGQELDRPYSGGAWSVSRNGVVAFTMGDALRPGDVGVARPGAAARRLTDLDAELLASRTLAPVEAFSVPSAYDKRPIDAWIMRPPGYDPARRYPMILEIHGGPFAAYGPNFASALQLYAAAGYVVVYANPRGSTSYGDEFANLINDNYPSQDYDDLMSVVDAAIARGGVDPDNLFVVGGSGGGLLTSWIVGKTHRFKAAVAQKPVIDWTSEVLTVDMYAFMARYWFGKMPWEDPMGYWKRSPLSLVGNVTTPTMVMVGEEDHRTPPSEAEQFFDALQLRGVPTAMVRVPGASHEELAGRPSQEAEEVSAILAWFGRYRTDGAAR